MITNQRFTQLFIITSVEKKGAHRELSLLKRSRNEILLIHGEKMNIITPGQSVTKSIIDKRNFYVWRRRVGRLLFQMA